MKWRRHEEEKMEKRHKAAQNDDKSSDRKGLSKFQGHEAMQGYFCRASWTPGGSNWSVRKGGASERVRVRTRCTTIR